VFNIFKKNNCHNIDKEKVIQKKYLSILESFGISPVLTDIGSAGVSHKIWQPISSVSTVIGFDADTRNTDKSFGDGYAKAILVNKAVTSDDNAEHVEFILTKYPSCSSMLEPDLDALSSFSFQDYFTPVDKQKVSATSINRTIKEQTLDGIHWLKLDSQGADLRLLKSISDEYIKNLFAIDIEPGLVKAYKNEDMFTDCHDWLINNGFWICKLEYQAYPKIRPSTLKTLSSSLKMDDKELIRRMEKSPTAVEGCYLRELDWLKLHCDSKAKLAMISVFGLLNQQLGYAYDVACLYDEMFGADDVSKKIIEIVSEGLK
jgi:methyltransferase FkbM-like protein